MAMNAVQREEFLAPDLLWQFAWFADWDEFYEAVEFVRSRRPNGIRCHYFSACTVTVPHVHPFPQTKLDATDLPEDWFVHDSNGDRILYSAQAGRYILDMRVEAARLAVINDVLDQAPGYGFNGIAFDNCYYNAEPWSSGGYVSRAEWTAAFMSFYEEAGRLINARGLKCYCNVATQVDIIPTAFGAIYPYIDGIMSENPYHDYVITNGLADAESAIYAEMSDAGKLALIITEDEARWDRVMYYGAQLKRDYPNVYVYVADWDDRDYDDFSRAQTAIPADPDTPP